MDAGLTSGQKATHTRTKHSRKNDQQLGTLLEQYKFIFDDNTRLYLPNIETESFRPLIVYDEDSEPTKKAKDFYKQSNLKMSKLRFHFRPDTNEFLRVFLNLKHDFHQQKKLDETSSFVENELKSPENEQSRFVFDWPTNTYLDNVTGLYYSSSSDLFIDFDGGRVPPFHYHYSPSDNRFIKVDLNNVEALDEFFQEVNLKNENESENPNNEKDLPPLLLLEWKFNDETTQTFSIGIKPVAKYDKITIGSDKNNIIAINDPLLNSLHSTIQFETFYWTKNVFWIVDNGSENGTFVNGKRLSKSFENSVEREHFLNPNDVITFGDQISSKHSITINLPSAGDISLALFEQQNKASRASTESIKEKTETTEDLNQTVEIAKQLKRMTRSFEFATEKKIKSNYRDRAAERQALFRDEKETCSSSIVTATTFEPKVVTTKRRTLYDEETSKRILLESEKDDTESTSIHEPLSEENRGFLLLGKMGWKKGEVLGKDNHSETALKEPIKAIPQERRQGLGYLSEK